MQHLDQRGYLRLGLVLIVVGASVLFPFLELLISYQSHPDAPSGLVVLTTFIRLGPLLALTGVIAGGVLLAAGVSSVILGFLKGRRNYATAELPNKLR